MHVSTLDAIVSSIFHLGSRGMNAPICPRGSIATYARRSSNFRSGSGAIIGTSTAYRCRADLLAEKARKARGRRELICSRAPKKSEPAMNCKWEWRVELRGRSYLGDAGDMMRFVLARRWWWE